MCRSCYRIWLHLDCSWSVWMIFLRKLVIPTVFMWCFTTRGGGRFRSTADGSLENRLHSVIRWRVVCTAFSGQLQIGKSVLFIICRYERKLPWFVRNCVRMKLGQRVRESLWKMVGMNSLVWDALWLGSWVGRQRDITRLQAGSRRWGLVELANLAAQLYNENYRQVTIIVIIPVSLSRNVSFTTFVFLSVFPQARGFVWEVPIKLYPVICLRCQLMSGNNRTCQARCLLKI